MREVLLQSGADSNSSWGWGSLTLGPSPQPNQDDPHEQQGTMKENVGRWAAVSSQTGQYTPPLLVYAVGTGHQ